MRILHTADWHLGQRLNQLERYEEHQQFLDWLLIAIEENRVEALVVAGDIFDTAHPAARAQEQYYNFLKELTESAVCRNVIIVGGNHDNPNLLNAPGPLLKALNIHIIGAIPKTIEEQCIVLPTIENPQVVVAGVPFLRDADIRQSSLGESIEEQEDRIRKGIAAHYEAVANCVSHYRDANIPVLVTGHLFAQGGDANSDSERIIHLGNLGQVTAEIFSEVFDYVALGHLHKQQIVGGREHIRYSGSPIPLSFSEADYKHQVLLLDFEGRRPPAIQLLPVPVTRKLLRAKGTLDEVCAKLREWDNSAYLLPAWVDVAINADVSPTHFNDELDKLNKELNGTLVVVSRRLDRFDSVESDASNSLAEIDDILDDPHKVFDSLLNAKQITDEAQRAELTRTFTELLSMEGISDPE